MKRLLTLCLLALVLAGCGSSTSTRDLPTGPPRETFSERSITGGRLPTPGLYRADTGRWYVLTDYGPEGARADAQFAYGGAPGDLPVTGDWDGNGTPDVGLYRRTDGRWFLLTERDASSPVADLKFSYGGDPSDLPLSGDFDGDGRDDPGLYRALTGTWYLLTGRVGEQPTSDLQIRFPGTPEAIPTVGDFDGDGRSDLALFDPSTGSWKLDLDRDGTADQTFVYGGAQGDLPVVGDFDGDGRDDPGVYRTSNGWWFLLTGRDANGPVSDVKLLYGGDPSDLPMVGDYNADGVSDPGVYRRGTGMLFLLTERDGGQSVADLKFQYGGDPSDLPLTPAPLLARVRPYPGDLPDSMLLQLTVEPATLQLPQGRTQAMTARGRYMDGSTRDVTTRVAWTSNLAAVSITGAGVVTAVGTSGSATIQAALGGLTGTATVTATPPVVEGLIFSPSNATMPLGGTLTFRLYERLSNGSNRVVDPASATWTNSDPVVAPMLAPGQFVGMAQGASTVTATRSGFTEDIVLTVTPAQVVSITLTPNLPLAPTGSDLAFRAVATYTDGVERDITGQARWTSSSTARATIDTAGSATPGVAHALTAGSTLITVADNATGASATMILVVTRPDQVAYARERVYGMATNPEGDRLYVLRPSRLYAYDSTTLEVAQSWPLQGGALALSPDGRYAVAASGKSLQVLDLSDGSRRYVLLSFDAVDVVFGERNRLYVLERYESDFRVVAVLDTTTWTEVSSTTVNGNAVSLGYSTPQDRLLYTRYGLSPDGLTSLDASTDALAQVDYEHIDVFAERIFLTGDGQQVLTEGGNFRSVADLGTIVRTWTGVTGAWFDLAGTVGRYYRAVNGATSREIVVNDSATLAEIERFPVSLNPTTLSMKRMQATGDGKAMGVYSEGNSSADPLLVLIRLTP